MKLNIKAFSLAAAVFWSLTILMLTLWVVVKGEVSNPFLDSYRTFYTGYDISYKGALIGGVWGFFDGLIMGAFLAWMYNKFVGWFC